MLSLEGGSGMARTHRIGTACLLCLRSRDFHSPLQFLTGLSGASPSVSSGRFESGQGEMIPTSSLFLGACSGSLGAWQVYASPEKPG